MIQKNPYFDESYHENGVLSQRSSYADVTPELRVRLEEDFNNGGQLTTLRQYSSGWQGNPYRTITFENGRVTGVKMHDADHDGLIPFEMRKGSDSTVFTVRMLSPDGEKPLDIYQWTVKDGKAERISFEDGKPKPELTQTHNQIGKLIPEKSAVWFALAALPAGDIEPMSESPAKAVSLHPDGIVKHLSLDRGADLKTDIHCRPLTEHGTLSFDKLLDTSPTGPFHLSYFNEKGENLSTAMGDLSSRNGSPANIKLVTWYPEAKGSIVHKALLLDLKGKTAAYVENTPDGKEILEVLNIPFESLGQDVIRGKNTSIPTAPRISITNAQTQELLETLRIAVFDHPSIANALPELCRLTAPIIERDPPQIKVIETGELKGAKRITVFGKIAGRTDVAKIKLCEENYKPDGTLVTCEEWKPQGGSITYFYPGSTEANRKPRTVFEFGPEDFHQVNNRLILGKITDKDDREFYWAEFLKLVTNAASTNRPVILDYSEIDRLEQKDRLFLVKAHKHLADKGVELQLAGLKGRKSPDQTLLKDSLEEISDTMAKIKQLPPSDNIIPEIFALERVLRSRTDFNSNGQPVYREEFTEAGDFKNCYKENPATRVKTFRNNREPFEAYPAEAISATTAMAR